MKGRATEDKIKRRLHEFTRGPIQTFVADVLSVNEESFSCELDPADDAKLINVRLKAAIDETIKSGLVEIPKVGSSVLAGIINNNPDDCFVVKVMEVDKIVGYVSQSSKIEITENGFTFNNGTLGGLINIVDLVSKLNDFINAHNAMMTEFNTAISVFNSHTHNVTAVGAPTGPSLVPATPSARIPLLPVMRAEIEDTKIKH